MKKLIDERVHNLFDILSGSDWVRGLDLKLNTASVSGMVCKVVVALVDLLLEKNVFFILLLFLSE